MVRKCRIRYCSYCTTWWSRLFCRIDRGKWRGSKRRSVGQGGGQELRSFSAHLGRNQSTAQHLLSNVMHCFIDYTCQYNEKNAQRARGYTRERITSHRCSEAL